MGSAKQALDFGGRPLLRHAASVALVAECGPVYVVLGARHDQMRPLLQGLPVQVVINERWESGIGTSIQAGLDAAIASEPDAIVLALADQPFVTAATLRTLLTRQRESGSAVVASRYSGTVGVPACFSRAAFPALMALAPDAGCKGVILAAPDALLIDCPEAVIDVDTPADYHTVSTRAAQDPSEGRT